MAIETERVFLREWLKENFYQFKSVAINPNVMRFIGTGEVWSDRDRACYTNISLNYCFNFQHQI